MKHKGSLVNYRIGQADSDKKEWRQVTEQDVINAVFNYCKPTSVKCQTCPLKTRICKKQKRDVFISLVKRVVRYEKAFKWTPSATPPRCHMVTFDDEYEKLISDEIIMLEEVEGHKSLVCGYYVGSFKKFQACSGRDVQPIAWVYKDSFINNIDY